MANFDFGAIFDDEVSAAAGSKFVANFALRVTDARAINAVARGMYQTRKISRLSTDCLLKPLSGPQRDRLQIRVWSTHFGTSHNTQCGEDVSICEA